MSLVLVGAVLPWILVVLGCLVGYRMLVLNGQILKRLEAIQKLVNEIVPAPTLPSLEGLKAGTVASAFELGDLRGGRMSLEQFRGRRVLLIFMGPHCIYCERMAPELAALPLDGREGRPVPLVISSGGLEDNVAFFDKYDVRCSVLVEGQGDGIAVAYKVSGTPSGYLIDEEGTLISDLAIGADTLFDLARNPDSKLIKTGENVAFLGMPKSPES